MIAKHIFKTEDISSACERKLTHLNLELSDLNQKKEQQDNELDSREFDAIRAFDDYVEKYNKAVKEKEEKRIREEVDRKERISKERGEYIKEAKEKWMKMGFFEKLFADKKQYLSDVERQASMIYRELYPRFAFYLLSNQRVSIEKPSMPNGFCIKDSMSPFLSGIIIIHESSTYEKTIKSSGSANVELKRKCNFHYDIKRTERSIDKVEKLKSSLKHGQEYVQLEPTYVEFLFGESGE